MWFNIGSIETFERNLENAQVELNIEPQNHVLVVYKDEIEFNHVLKILPQLLLWGKLHFPRSRRPYVYSLLVIVISYCRIFYFLIAKVNAIVGWKWEEGWAVWIGNGVHRKVN